MTQHTPYEELEKRFRDIALIGEAASVLHWDLSVVMPKGGAEARGEQMAALHVLKHNMLIDPTIETLLAAAEETQSSLNDWQKANIREMKRDYVHATAVPSDLVEAHSKACSSCESVWRIAKEDSDFDAVLPNLQHVLDLTKEMGQAKSEKLSVNLYDALLDQFEPDGRAADIEPIFNDYAAFLPEFLGQVIEKQNSDADLPPLRGKYEASKQRDLTHKFAQTVGFDFDAGRLDESAHPFSTGHRGDQRITVRYEDDEFAQGLMAVLHECGHAMYEKQLPTDWALQPVGQSRGMAIHESQSLVVEMQACRSREFYDFAAPIIQKLFLEDNPNNASAYSAENLHRHAIHVKPDFIRVDADEVTYPAHVILRFRLEKALLEGHMSLKDLPAAWNDGMQDLLGITPPNHALGCMQDIH
ncbi:MAG: carboxypeptidase M32, partial [Alphaproteobacteria bacterium]|nr:carboxypeptidase M32 [Alphaproteobacteria bacterium]